MSKLHELLTEFRMYYTITPEQRNDKYRYQKYLDIQNAINEILMKEENK